jgi:hypothetical protein
VQPPEPPEDDVVVVAGGEVPVEEDVVPYPAATMLACTEFSVASDG